MTDFLLTLIGAALVNNLLLGQPLAADAVRHARVRALGPASALLILFAAPGAWLVGRLLHDLALDHLYLFAFLPVLAGLAWLVPRLLARLRPAALQPGLWPLLVGNGLGAMLLAKSLEGLPAALALGLGGGLGLWLALQLIGDLFERIEQCDVPAPFRGMPILLIAAGLMGLALLGFNGMGAA